MERIGREIDESYRNFIITRDLMEWRNVATVARWFIHCARMRKESRAVP
jgi:aspartate oxidase